MSEWLNWYIAGDVERSGAIAALGLMICMALSCIRLIIDGRILYAILAAAIGAGACWAMLDFQYQQHHGLLDYATSAMVPAVSLGILLPYLAGKLSLYGNVYLIGWFALTSALAYYVRLSYSLAISAGNDTAFALRESVSFVILLAILWILLFIIGRVPLIRK